MKTLKIEDLYSAVMSVTGGSPDNQSLSRDLELLGVMPELDSIAIVNLIVELENRYLFKIEDDEVEFSIFETLGSLLDFAQHKLDVNSLDSSGTL